MPGRPARTLPEVRREKVARIREALDAGRYDLDARLQDMLGELAAGLAAANL
jgi:anti-sigma28 factor (negative regulator of flagellin synthesis)